MLWRNHGYADDDVGDDEIFLFDSFLFLLLLLLLFVRGPLSACASRSVCRLGYSLEFSDNLSLSVGGFNDKLPDLMKAWP